MGDNSILFSRHSFVIFIGVVMMLLGGFMVSDVHTWTVFSVWLPFAALTVGILLLGSKTYSTSLGIMFLVFAGLIWLHQSGVIMFPLVTAIIDWAFVVLGAATIAVSVLDLRQKRPESRVR
jgi:hypothetical protein